MKKYFITEKGKSSLPLTFEDLEKLNINGETLICEKFGTWKPAKDYPELADLFWRPPPPPESIWEAPPVPETPSPEIEVPKRRPRRSPAMNFFLSIPKKMLLLAAAVSVLGTSALMYNSMTTEVTERVVSDEISTKSRDSLTFQIKKINTKKSEIQNKLNTLLNSDSNLEADKQNMEKAVSEASATLNFLKSQRGIIQGKDCCNYKLTCAAMTYTCKRKELDLADIDRQILNYETNIIKQQKKLDVFNKQNSMNLEKIEQYKAEISSLISEKEDLEGELLKLHPLVKTKGKNKLIK